MKGYQESTESTGKRFLVKHGTICEESKRPIDGWKSVIVVNPTTKEELTRYIRSYNAVEAYVTKLEYRDTGDKYDQRFVSWELHLVNDDGDPATLSISLNSQIASRFMKTAESINWGKPVEFRAWHDKQTDPPKTAFLIAQDGVSVPQLYTKDHPGTMPQPTERRTGWDYGDQEDWLINRMLEVVVPAVDAAEAARGGGSQNAPAAARQPATRPAPETPASGQPAAKIAPRDDDDLPEMTREKKNMLLALARGANQSDQTLDATIKGFFPGQSLELITDAEADIVMGYFRDMMQSKKS